MPCIIYFFPNQKRKKERKKTTLVTIRIRFQFFQKLYKEAEGEEQQFLRSDLYLIIKILKAGFAVLRIRAHDFREFYYSPRLSFLIKSDC